MVGFYQCLVNFANTAVVVCKVAAFLAVGIQWGMVVPLVVVVEGQCLRVIVVVVVLYGWDWENRAVVTYLWMARPLVLGKRDHPPQSDQLLILLKKK